MAGARESAIRNQVYLHSHQPPQGGTCLDSRNLEEGDLRPRSSMDEYLRIVEDADKVLTSR